MTQVDIRNGRDDFISAGMPSLLEMTRRGRHYATMATSAVAGLVVRPTTVAALELYNGNAAGGASLIVNRLFTHHLVSTAVNNGAVIYAMVTAAKVAPSSASLAIKNMTGRSATYGALGGIGGGVVNAVGTTVVDNGWFPYGPNYVGVNAATPGGGWEANVLGNIIVPPGSSLCVHVVSSIVGDTFTSGASWFEEIVEMDY